MKYIVILLILVCFSVGLFIVRIVVDERKKEMKLAEKSVLKPDTVIHTDYRDIRVYTIIVDSCEYLMIDSHENIQIIPK